MTNVVQLYKPVPGPRYTVQSYSAGPSKQITGYLVCEDDKPIRGYARADWRTNERAKKAAEFDARRFNDGQHVPVQRIKPGMTWAPDR